MKHQLLIAGILALLPALAAAQDTPPAPPGGGAREFPQPRMVEGQGFETRPPEKSDDRPLFPQQTRAPYHKAASYKVTTLTDKLRLPWSIAFCAIVLAAARDRINGRSPSFTTSNS